MPRNGRLARVHIARKELALDEASYRAVLVRITGHDSAGKCSDPQLESVLEEFKRLGWTPATKRSPQSKKPHVRLIWALWGQLRPHLRDGSAKAEPLSPRKGVAGAGLRSFCLRMTQVSDPEWLDGAQANLVIEGLKAWLKRVQSPAEKAQSDG